MKDSEVMVRSWPNAHIPYQFFRVMDQEVPLAVGACGHFYEQDEYEMVSGVVRGAVVQVWLGVSSFGQDEYKMVSGVVRGAVVQVWLGAVFWAGRVQNGEWLFLDHDRTHGRLLEWRRLWCRCGWVFSFRQDEYEIGSNGSF
jgi:hypothetical protein